MGYWCRGCCTGFWGSVPYATLLAITVTVLGLIGHVASVLHGTITISRVYPFENVDNLFIPFVGALSGLTTLPMVMSFILALLSTGYSRNIIYFYHFEKCIGATFTILTITMTFVFTLIWLLYGFLLTAVVMVAIGLQIACDELEAIAGPQGLDDPNLCLPLATGLNGTGIVGEDVCGDSGLQDLCDDGKLAGDGFATSLGFIVVVVTGQVLHVLDL
ncbi:uncharacterized protein [Dysidea avara]|uniref:uncharacterized protein isoform X2 n=1 Tax=Dysidea avara TaxID=196820 RepID=UPI00332559C6